MAQELIRRRTPRRGGSYSLTKNPPWHTVALAAVLVLAAFLNLYRIWSLGYANTYYAAAVKDMLRSWHNFFFVSFDAGFVSVDKPPLGLWIQTASAWLFGFHGWSLLLPQALAGVGSVAILYYLVGRTFGRGAGLLAALTLALTPIVVATSRNNTADMLLVFTVLLAAWAVIRSVETGRLRWLLLCAVLVGLGFNIKMMQAFLVLPAFYLLYLLAARVRWPKRLVHLALATVVLITVSFSWATVVELTPANERPYVGSSEGNSVYNLILGYNGLGRLLGDSNPLTELLSGSDTTSQAQQGPATDRNDAQRNPGTGFGGGGMGMNEYGSRSPVRLLNQQMAGQISWLLPLALIGAVAVAWRRRPSFPLGRKYQGLVLWGMWTVTIAAYFSVASWGHRYYLVMLAPGLAALVGAGTMALWRDYRRPGWRGWALPFALVATGAAQAYILRSYEGWNLYLTSTVAILCLAAAVLLVAGRLKSTGEPGRYATVAATVGVLSLFIAPAAWAGYTVISGSSGGLPAAGPQAAGVMGGMPGGMGAGPNSAAGRSQDAQVQGAQSPRTASGPGRLNARPPMGAMGPGGMQDDGADTKLINYLERNQGNAEYLVAGTSSMNTASIILNTDEPVIAMGGFGGRDPVFTVKEISNLVESGKLRYFLIQDQGPVSWQPSAGKQSSTEGLNDESTGNSSNGPPEGSTNGPAAPPSSGQQGMSQQMPPGARRGEAPPGMAPNDQRPEVGRSTPQMPQGARGADSRASGSNDPGSRNPTSQSYGSPQSGSSIPMGSMPGGGLDEQQTKITRWVKNNCEKVPAGEYSSSGSSGSRFGGPFSQGGSLYACDPSPGSDNTSSTRASRGSTNASDGAFGDAMALALRKISPSATAAYTREA